MSCFLFYPDCYKSWQWFVIFFAYDSMWRWTKPTQWHPLSRSVCQLQWASPCIPGQKRCWVAHSQTSVDDTRCTDETLWSKETQVMSVQGGGIKWQHVCMCIMGKCHSYQLIRHIDPGDIPIWSNEFTEGITVSAGATAEVQEFVALEFGRKWKTTAVKSREKYSQVQLFWYLWLFCCSLNNQGQLLLEQILVSMSQNPQICMLCG